MPCGVIPRKKAERLTVVGSNVKRLMAERGRKHLALCEDAGISKNSLTRVFYDTENVAVSIVERVAGAFGVPVRQLFDPDVEEWECLG